ncbi:Hsp20/alpha crystallin family protein [bacterium]|nr:MAG: Hsp20/alpha crystallin family protein [bacterium]
MTNALLNWDPFRELDDMQERMSRLATRGLTNAGQWLTVPATDIYEEDGRLVVETALPQFKESEVDVQINGDRLEIKAEHSQESHSRNYLRRESSQASYYRSFVLPKDVDAESGQADFADGVLKISFERRELPQPKKLKLASSAKKSLTKGDKPTQ